jgi:hypothetical protein
MTMLNSSHAEYLNHTPTLTVGRSNVADHRETHVPHPTAASQAEQAPVAEVPVMRMPPFDHRARLSGRLNASYTHQEGGYGPSVAATSPRHCSSQAHIAEAQPEAHPRGPALSLPSGSRFFRMDERSAADDAVVKQESFASLPSTRMPSCD